MLPRLYEALRQTRDMVLSEAMMVYCNGENMYMYYST